MHCEDSADICSIRLKRSTYSSTRDWNGNNRSAGHPKPSPLPQSHVGSRLKRALGTPSVTLVCQFHSGCFLTTNKKPNPFSNFATCFHGWKPFLTGSLWLKETCLFLKKSHLLSLVLGPFLKTSLRRDHCLFYSIVLTQHQSYRDTEFLNLSREIIP